MIAVTVYDTYDPFFSILIYSLGRLDTLKDNKLNDFHAAALRYA